MTIREEEILKSAEQDGLLRRVVELGGIGTALFSEEQRVVWAAGRLPGVAAADAIGRTCHELFALTDVPCEPCLLERSLREGPFQLTVRVDGTGGGTSRVFEVSVSHMSEGGTTRWLEVAREVPAPDAALAALQPCQPDPARLVANWPVPGVIVDRDGVVRAWNRGAASLYERGQEEAVGHVFEELVGEEHPLEPLPAPGAGTRRYEARHRSAGGSIFDVMVTRTELDPAASGSGEFVLVTDLSGSRAVEGRLKRRIAQLSVMREIGEALQSMMGLNGILRTILVGATASQGFRFNRAFLLLVEPKLGRLRGRFAIGPSDPEEAHRIWSQLALSETGLKHLLRTYEPFLERENSRVNDIVRSLDVRLDDGGSLLIQVLRSGSTTRVANGVTLGGGSPADAELMERLGVSTFVAVPLQAEGKPVGLLLADNAITSKPIEDEDVWVLELLGMQAGLAIERAQLTGELETQIASLEEATRQIRSDHERLVRAERLSAIGEMAAKVAHEIRNPLVAIGGFARLLLREVPATSPLRENIQIIVAEVRRLEAVVQDVLDFSNPAQPQLGSLDLVKLSLDALDLLQWEMREAGVEGHLEADPGLPLARADRNQIFQAVVNVMRNAIHAMPHGGRLTLRIRSVPGWLEMGVRDTGVGIPPEVLSRVFEPFFTTKSTGSGLGLTIASQIIREHRGEVHVESQVGSGATIYVRIPAAEGDHVEDSHR